MHYQTELIASLNILLKEKNNIIENQKAIIVMMTKAIQGQSNSHHKALHFKLSNHKSTEFLLNICQN